MGYRKLNIGRAHTRPILHNSYLQCLSVFFFEKTRRLAPGNLGSSPHDHSQGTLLETGKTKSGYIKLLQCPCFDNHSIREHHLIIIDLLGETIGQNNNLLKKIRVARLNSVNYLSLRSSDESRSEHSMGNLVLGEFDESLFFFPFYYIKKRKTLIYCTCRKHTYALSILYHAIVSPTIKFVLDLGSFFTLERVDRTGNVMLCVITGQ